MISTDSPTNPRHAMPPGSDDQHEHHARAVLVRLNGRAPAPSAFPSVHAKPIENQTMPMSRLDIIAQGSFILAVELYAIGAEIAFAPIDRGQCQHCQAGRHVTSVRFYPNPARGRSVARTSVPDACGCCAPKVLVELLDEAEGRDVHVEVWHPKAGA
jgi:hypothetical protein